MNLVKFIDNRFQELRMQEQLENARKEYSLPRDAEVLALQLVLEGYRRLMKWVMVPKVLINFIAVKMGLRQEPEPVMIRKLEEDQQRDLNKKARKLGMMDKIKPVPDAGAEPLPN